MVQEIITVLILKMFTLCVDPTLLLRNVCVCAVVCIYGWVFVYLYVVMFMYINFLPTACPPIRLIAGANNFEGRIEVYYQNQWGTVCDDFWDLNDANVACRQLGLGAATAALSFSTFGQGSGNIWLDNLRCGGTEDCLGNCTHNGWGVHNCAHFEDAGVRCTGMCIIHTPDQYLIAV